MTDKILPPHDLGAEEAVLGSVIIDPDAIHEVPSLRGEMFFEKGNGRVFDVMRRMVLDGVTPDFVTLPEELDRAGVKYDLGDLVGLMNVVPTSVEIKNYAGVVYKAWKRRSIASAAEVVASAAMSDTNTLAEALETASKALLDVSVDDTSSSTQNIRKAASKALDEVSARYAAGGVFVGTRTGYDEVDEVSRGMQDSELYLIGARPGMGKTSLLFNVALKLAVAGKRVVIFSLEMGAEQIAIKMAGVFSGVQFGDIQEGRLDATTWPKVATALAAVSELDIVIDDTPATTVSQMHAKTMRLMAEGHVDIVMVDYLQLMGSDGQRMNRVQEVGSFSRGLKGLAKKLNIPILAAVQLSRKVEDRQNKRPMMTDLRDSGEIEQDAAGIWMMYREDYYADEDDEEEMIDVVPGKTELNMVKNRFGPTGMCYLMFDGYSGKFSDWGGSIVVNLPGPGGQDG